MYHLSRWIHYGTSPTEELKITTEAHMKSRFVNWNSISLVVKAVLKSNLSWQWLFIFPAKKSTINAWRMGNENRRSKTIWIQKRIEKEIPRQMYWFSLWMPSYLHSMDCFLLFPFYESAGDGDRNNKKNLIQGNAKFDSYWEFIFVVFNKS